MKTVMKIAGVAVVAAAVFAPVQPVTTTVTAAAAQPAVQPPSAHASPLAPDEGDPVPMSGCYACGRDSTGACAREKGKSAGVQCRGTRKRCREKGCKITGTHSCSSAANKKTC